MAGLQSDLRRRNCRTTGAVDPIPPPWAMVRCSIVSHLFDIFRYYREIPWKLLSTALAPPAALHPQPEYHLADRTGEEADHGPRPRPQGASTSTVSSSYELHTPIQGDAPRPRPTEGSSVGRDPRGRVSRASLAGPLCRWGDPQRKDDPMHWIIYQANLALSIFGGKKNFMCQGRQSI